MLTVKGCCNALSVVLGSLALTLAVSQNGRSGGQFMTTRYLFHLLVGCPTRYPFIANPNAWPTTRTRRRTFPSRLDSTAE